MIDKSLKALVDAPLADPAKLAIHGKPRVIRRGSRTIENDDIGAPKLTRQQMAEKKNKAFGEKLNSLLDYYATTDLTAAKVAEHLGIYRQEQDGLDDKGKPTFKRVLDIQRVEQQLAWRRKADAA